MRVFNVLANCEYLFFPPLSIKLGCYLFLLFTQNFGNFIKKKWGELMTEFINNDQLQLAFDFVQYTGKHIFLTGKAGTGKTTFLHQLKRFSPKRMVVVAPTGVAAINAGGVTIHSFFQMPFGPILPVEISGSQNPGSSENIQKFNREKVAILKSLDLLVIDEISMVRADLLDGIDGVLRRYKDRNQPFGGVQLLMIGDLQQLAPVVKDDEWNLLRPFYDSVYFFSSLALKKTDYISIELTHIFRQRDEAFIKLLNKIRDNNADQRTLDELNKRYIPGFVGKESEGYISLTTHNYQSQNLNESMLAKLLTKAHRFSAKVEGEFPEYSYPTEYDLFLKVGAQVMFVKNDISRDKLFYNGKIGTVVDIDEDLIRVNCPGDSDDIEVGKVEWQNTKYTIDDQTKEIKESVLGTFSQIPLKLAWAITIHKSQGLTFEKAVIDSQAAFAHGQVYVALSRCKTLEGMVLSTPISNQSLKSDSKISHFNNDIQQNPPGKELLEESKLAFQRMLLFELFDFQPLFRRSAYCFKLMVEHQESIHAILKENIQQINQDLRKELCDISEKFKGQLNQLLEANKQVEENTPLQERVRKASQYFSDKLEPLVIEKLKGLDIEIDNKAVRKSVNDAITRLNDDAHLKLACLIGCKEGFSVKKYMEIRAKSSIEPTEKKPKFKGASLSPDGLMPHPELYKSLKIWRNQKADDLNIDAYLILPQKTLLELVTHLPVTLAELKRIKGFGAMKVSNFGKEIVPLIIAYRIEKKMDVPLVEFDPNQEEETKPPKIDSKKVSFELFHTGKSIGEIATERSMAFSTIEGHLAHYIRTGDLNIEKLVAKDKISVITQWFLKNSTTNLGMAKAALGDSVNYTELKCVLNYLVFTNQISS